jgi:hypothetical protein
MVRYPVGRRRVAWGVVKRGLDCPFNCVELHDTELPTDVPNPGRGCMFIDTLRTESPSGRIVRLHSRRVVTTRPDVTAGARNYKHATPERGWEVIGRLLCY